MARRLTLEDIEVVGVFELMPHANGLNRNIVQCLQDFDIPLHLSTTIVEIHGDHRVNKVTVAPVDAALRPATRPGVGDRVRHGAGVDRADPGKRTFAADAAASRPGDAGPLVTSTMECTRDGVFACGNVVHIHDIVDFVSAEAALAGRSAGQYVTGTLPRPDNVRLQPGKNVAYCVPHTISTEREHIVYFCVRAASVGNMHLAAGGAIRENSLRQKAALCLSRGNGQLETAACDLAAFSWRYAAHRRGSERRSNGRGCWRIERNCMI